MTTHKLKVIQPFFDAVSDGSKNFEVRRDDRGFESGDRLWLAEWDGEKFTGQGVARTVTYVLRGGQFGVEPGHVVMGLGPVDR